jgi:SAM-dependent methyltransferase
MPLPNLPQPSTLELGLRALLGTAARLPVLDPLGQGLRAHRERQLLAARDAALPRTRPLAAAVLSGDAEAVARHDGLVQEALQHMRGARGAGAAAALSLLDQVLYKNSEELLDDPAFPEGERLQIIESVDWLNRQLGSYDLWTVMLGELLDEAARRRGGPARLFDLAAGHGGFAIALKQRLGERAEITASDIRPEYLEIGKERAAQAGVEVRFVRQDATDLRGLADEVDVFVCTQSLHHFPPGMVSRIFGQAARHARVGVCFIDAERGVLPLLLLPPIMAAHGKTYAVFHDTWVSLRRMYYAEELGLLAHLAPGLPSHAGISAERHAPGFACVKVRV